jgi:NAD(P)H-nitrite reductase large subunit
MGGIWSKVMISPVSRLENGVFYCQGGKAVKYLIIGNGIAGIQAAETIRQLDSDSHITLIGGETFPPYCRPMISLLVGGHIRPEDLHLRHENFFSSLSIEHITGEWVTSIDVENKEVTSQGGNRFPFDRLLIATGSAPRLLKTEGSHLEKVFYMRTEEDAKKVIWSLSESRRAVILGAGLVGLKIAQALLDRGLKVTMVERLERPLPFIVDETAGQMLTKQLQRLGMELITGCRAEALAGNGEVKEVHLSDGSTLPCDLVVTAIGVQPSTSFIPPEKIHISTGVLTDRYLETNVPGIYAAGDVTETPDILSSERRVNAIWPVAVRQGTFAGMNMAGRRVDYGGSLTRNVVRVGDMDILSGGLINPPVGGDYTIHCSEEHRFKTYRKLVFQEDALVGVILVNRIEQGGIFLSMIREKIPVTDDKDKMLGPSFNYRQLMPSIHI